MLSGTPIETSYDVLVLYGQFNRFVLSGWYWQLFTAMFVHVNITHLLGNMLFLLIFGLRAEDLFTIKEYVFIYLSSGLVGNLFTLLLPLNTISAGASGAIFGVFGANTIYIKRAVGQSIIGALIYSFFLFVLSSGIQVNYLAHLGGLVIGLLIGYMLASRRKIRIEYQYNFAYSQEH
jgi:rhomboid protease GluP